MLEWISDLIEDRELSWLLILLLVELAALYSSTWINLHLLLLVLSHPSISILALVLLRLLLLLFFCISLVVITKMLLYHLLLLYAWSCMYLSIYFSISEEIIVALHKLATCFFIETALWERHYQQTFDDFEYIWQRPISWVPILLQSIHTDLTWWDCNIWMEYLCQEKSYQQK
jgi:hypothetical protein